MRCLVKSLARLKMNVEIGWTDDFSRGKPNKFGGTLDPVSLVLPSHMKSIVIEPEVPW